MHREEDNKIEKKLDIERDDLLSFSHIQSARESVNLNHSPTPSRLDLDLNVVRSVSERINNNSKQNSIRYDANNDMKTDNTFYNGTNCIEKNSFEYNYMNTESKNTKIFKIIKNIKNWFYKKRFVENEKENMVEINRNIYNSYLNSENVKKLQKLDLQCKEKFDLNGWKKYYKEFPFDLLNLNTTINKNEIARDKNGIIYEKIFGKTFISKKMFLGKNSIKDMDIEPKHKNYYININMNSNEDYHPNASYTNIKNKNDNIQFKGNTEENKENKENSEDRKNYIYVGDVNKFNQKHGKGYLYTLDGSCMQNGTWFEDNLIGWVRKIYTVENGIAFEGKFYFSYSLI